MGLLNCITGVCAIVMKCACKCTDGIYRECLGEGEVPGRFYQPRQWMDLSALGW